MPRYVDGFVIPLKKSKVAAYRKMAAKAGKIWMEHGALEYMECVGDDLNIKMCKSFKQLAKPKPNETVVFSYIAILLLPKTLSVSPRQCRSLNQLIIFNL